MTDPGGGYGWRSGRHVPRQRGGIFGWGRMADEESARFEDERPLAVLLLPVELERFDLRERAEDLLTAPGVVAVDPPRLSYARIAGISEAVADGIANVQARRIRLPGHPRALVVFHPHQYPLARALWDAHPDSEIWYGSASEPVGEREQALHQRALERASLRFIHTDDAPAHTQNLPLWERLEKLGIESGRLGSERADIS
jgi:hypothetical protein